MIRVTADTVGVFSPGLWRLRGLETFLGARRVVFRPSRWRSRDLDAVVGWGHKPTADHARAFARRHGVPYLALEDGFLRSVGLGQDEPPLSLVVDDVGIYYDARAPSLLEDMLAFRGPADPLTENATLTRARACRARICAERLSKYNHAPDRLPPEWVAPRDDQPVVLVVDQTYDDASVTQGLGSARTFDLMLEAARDEHPDAHIVVKVHPATVAGYKRGYLANSKLAGINYLASPVSPAFLLERADHVYVCSSQLGFDALLQEKRVSCFGAPFYSGWGLTEDHAKIARRGRERSLDELVAAALLTYPRYVDHARKERCEVEDVIEHLSLQKRMAGENDRHFYCVGFSTWKRPFVRRYLESPVRNGSAKSGGGGRVRFVRSTRALGRDPLEPDAAVVLWGSRAAAPRMQTTSGKEVPVLRMEDGFLRSVGLGSQLTAPGSLVLDGRGLYYDPSRPSDLEAALAEASFSEAELARARRLRAQIVSSGVSKYNTTSAGFRAKARRDQPVVLVVGQVEDDASIELGSPTVRTNAGLVREARALRPDAHLVYKPHPDVVSGNRRGAVEASGPYDECVVDASLPACLATADEVHTMTSLVGFEALLRDIPVVTYGQPFYAGWGLTDDRHPPPRRSRRLTLDELVAGALIRYPRYYNFEIKAFCTAEDKVAELSRQKAHPPRFQALTTPWIVRRVHDVLILSREWLRA